MLKLRDLRKRHWWRSLLQARDIVLSVFHGKESITFSNDT